MMKSSPFDSVPRLSRRRALAGAIGATTLWLQPGTALAKAGTGANRLVLIELKGGNDGLNTVVPHRDGRYAQLRPQLALRDDEIVAWPGSTDFALHAGLAPWLAAAKAGDLAVVQGLGYPRPNRSHFRSIEIWHSASDADETRSEGWLSALAPAGDELFAVNLGTDEAGPLLGTQAMLTLPTRGRLSAPPTPTANKQGRPAALAHVIDTERRLASAIAEVAAADVQGRRKLRGDAFGQGKLNQALAQVASLIAGGAGRVFRVQHRGFDTHKNQRNVHARLLGELASGLATFREVLQGLGVYEQVLIVTYSEFGRRAAQNRSGGTDHGTAAPHFVMGGAVRGGAHGQAPSLYDLDGGDLKFTVDYRRLYRTCADWLGASPGRAEAVLGRHRALGVLR